MLARQKVQKYKNQIRRRQKQKIISELRSKLYEFHDEQDRLKTTAIWKSFVKNPNRLIPIQMVQYFSNLEHQDLKVTQKIVNQWLCPQEISNVLFVTLCIQAYQIRNFHFFKKVIEYIKQDRKQDKVNEKQMAYKLSKLTQLNTEQEVYIDYFVKYLSHVQASLKNSLDDVVEMKQYFVKYWNKYVQNEQYMRKKQGINFKLCAQMAERFIYFKYEIKDLNIIVNAIVNVHIQQDDSLQTYILVKMAVRQNTIEDNLKIILHPKFNQFICNGLRDLTTKETIQILQKIMDNRETSKKLSINFNKILRKMLEIYNQTQNSKVQSCLLYGFYNFAFSQIPSIEEFFLELDYQQMFLKTYTKNLFDFYDFCLAVLFQYPHLNLYKKIVFGEKIKLLDLIGEQITENMSQQCWKLADDLWQVLQVGIQKNIFIHELLQKIEIIIIKLQQLNWQQQKGKKQQMVQEFEKLAAECRQRLII